MIVLGIETTCDETAASIVVDGKKILSNVIASQTAMHSAYGGVYPELASRGHINAISSVILLAIEQAGIEKKDIDLISVARGPGLIGSLLVGLNTAKTMSMALNIPFVGVNHVEAHLYASMMAQDAPIMPALGVVLSGGHTFLIYMQSPCNYTLIGTTIDDAIGEAFDKVGVMLGLPYPGGPEIEKIAKNGHSDRFKLKAGVVKVRPMDFSFSGLKTNVFYLINGQNAQKGEKSPLDTQEKADIAASFQKTAFSDVIKKCKMALQKYPCQAIYLGGGVTSNQYLKDQLISEIRDIPLFFPQKGLSIDNAAMIAGLGYHVFLDKNKKGDHLDLPALTRIPFTSKE